MNTNISALAQGLVDQQWRTRALYAKHTRLRPELSEESRAALLTKVVARGQEAAAKSPGLVEHWMRQEAQSAFNQELRLAQEALPLTGQEQAQLESLRGQQVPVLTQPLTEAETRTLVLALEERVPVVIQTPDGVISDDLEELMALGVSVVGTPEEGREVARDIEERIGRYAASIRQTLEPHLAR